MIQGVHVWILSRWAWRDVDQQKLTFFHGYVDRYCTMPNDVSFLGRFHQLTWDCSSSAGWTSHHQFKSIFLKIKSQVFSLNPFESSIFPGVCWKNLPSGGFRALFIAKEQQSAWLQYPSVYDKSRCFTAFDTHFRKYFLKQESVFLIINSKFDTFQGFLLKMLQGTIYFP